MEKDRVQRYAQSLERTVQNNYHYLKETMEDFQQLCRVVGPEKNVPGEIILDIREMYKEIRSQLTEVKAIQQLLQSKYRQYYRRDSIRDKEILEFGFVAKNCYSKFEYTLIQIEAMKRLKETERSPKEEYQEETFQWFCSKENQVAFTKNLRILMELDYENTPEEVGKERRNLAGERTLTLFLFNGDPLSIEKLHSQIQLREHDIMERSGKDELRGVLAHLRGIDPSELGKKFRSFMESRGFTKLKCLLLPIHSPKELHPDLSGLMKAALEKMAEGEVKTLPI